jgi:hypothetical protein
MARELKEKDDATPSGVQSPLHADKQQRFPAT